jgi:hypothetical protein
MAAGKTAAEPEVQRGNAGRGDGVFISSACHRKPGPGGGEGAIQLAVAEKGFKIGACEQHLIFALSSPHDFNARRASESSVGDPPSIRDDLRR